MACPRLCRLAAPTYAARIVALALAALLAWPCPAQAGSVDYRALWRAWTAEARLVFLAGFRSGVHHALAQGLAEIMGGRPEAATDAQVERAAGLHEAVSLSYGLDDLRRAMDELYKDPANGKVMLSEMVYIAQDRLAGRDVTERLERARRRAQDAGQVKAAR